MNEQFDGLIAHRACDCGGTIYFTVEAATEQIVYRHGTDPRTCVFKVDEDRLKEQILERVNAWLEEIHAK